jgi:phage shock protein C
MPRKKAAKRKVKEKDVLDQRVEHFGEEVGKLGGKFGKRMEERGKEWESWFHRTFGLVGPLISSIFGIIILALVSWVIYLVNMPIGSGFILNVYYFLTDNMGLFFLIFLFFSYTSYFSKASPRVYSPFSPIAAAIGITIGFWIASQAIDVANISLGIPWLSIMAFYMGVNLHLIFLFFLFLGYLALAIKITLEVPKRGMEREVSMKRAEKPKPGEIHRLYRSGKDRILGGVCGGIAEYLGVDPVIIRLLWIAGTLAWGAGIILYIIFWIVIPRNPNHKWRD